MYVSICKNKCFEGYSWLSNSVYRYLQNMQTNLIKFIKIALMTLKYWVDYIQVLGSSLTMCPLNLTTLHPSGCTVGSAMWCVIATTKSLNYGKCSYGHKNYKLLQKHSTGVFHLMSKGETNNILGAWFEEEWILTFLDEFLVYFNLFWESILYCGHPLGQKIMSCFDIRSKTAESVLKPGLV